MSELLSDFKTIKTIETEFEESGIIIDTAEDLYDSFGFAVCIAVTKENQIVISSKHWVFVYYIETKFQTTTDKNPVQLWDLVVSVANTKKYDIMRDENENVYVYIPKQTRENTNQIFESILDELRDRKIMYDVFSRFHLYGWDVNKENAIIIPWIK